MFLSRFVQLHCNQESANTGQYSITIKISSPKLDIFYCNPISFSHSNNLYVIYRF